MSTSENTSSDPLGSSRDQSAVTLAWQPEDIAALALAVARLERELPEWWWRVGACHLTADATIGPDLAGEDAWLLDVIEFFDSDLPQPASCAAALHDCIDQGKAARAQAMSNRTANL